MFFDDIEKQSRISDTKALGEPTTFADRTVAAYDASMKRDRINAREFNLSQAYDERIKAIKDAIGLDLVNPMNRGGATGAEMGEVDTTDYHAEFQKELEALAKKHPDKLDIIRPDKPVAAQARDTYGDAVQRETDAGRNYGGPTGTGPVADFIGGMGAVARDPVQAPTILLGPTSPVRQGVRAIVGMGLKQAAVNAGTQAMFEPIIQQYRKDMGDVYGISQAAANVVVAGAFGFGMDAGGRAAYRAGQRAFGRVAISDPKTGGVVGYESREASEARAAAEARRAAVEALPPETLQRAQDGDTRAIREVLTATGEIEDPSVRGALDHMELHPELRDSPIDDLDYGQRERQMLRAMMDGAEPFPVDVPPVAKSTAPDLNDFAELPKGIDGNQHYRNFEIDGKPVSFRNIDPKSVTTDATAFQFKEGGDAAGVTGRLGSVRVWDPMASGKVVVFERADGSLVIADGHQRLGLATALIDQNPELQGFVFRERDGWTPADVRALAAKKNLQEGSGSIIDAAKIIRNRPDIIDDSMPLGSEFMRLSRALARLSDDAFGKVIGGVVEPKHGAMVADLVHNKDQHGAVIDELARLDPKTDREARVAIGEIIRAPLTMDEQISLFGGSVAPRFLMQERVGVLDGALQTLRRDQRVFSTLADNAERAAEVGNKLKTKANIAQALEAETVAAVVEKLAQRSGYVSNLLNQAAKSVSEGQPKQRAIDAFLRQIADKIRESGVRGLDDDAVVLASLPQTTVPERLARAQAMGFDTTRVLYHGTGDAIDAFDLAKAQDKEGRKRGLGLGKGKVYLTGNQWSAGEWAMQAPDRGLGSSPNVMPVFVRGALLDEPAYHAKFKELSGGKDIFDSTLSMKERDAIIAKTDEWAKGEGYAGIQQVYRDQKTGDIMETGQVAMFNPDDIRSVNARFEDDGPVLLAALSGSDTSVGKSMRADLDALGYYSKALEAAKAWPQTKGTPEQALMWLKKSGVKDAEIEATGVAKAFEGQKSVTRDDVVKHLTDNRVGLRKVVRGDSSMQREFSRIDAELAELELAAPNWMNRERIADLNRRRNEILDQPEVDGETRWSSYSLDPSNPTYRETVLHLPEAQPSFEQFLKARQNAGMAYPDPSPEMLARYRAEYNAGGWRGAALGRQEAWRGAADNTFRSGHFDEPNIIGHMMTSMTKHEGKPVYTIDQIQSDWGQKLRDGGVRDEAKIAELERQIKADPEVNALVAKWGTPQRAKFEIMKTGASQDIIERLNELPLLMAELETVRAASPGNPLVNTTDQWTTTTLRRALRQAAEADAEFIAIPTGDTVLSYNPGDTDGMRGFYGATRVRDAAKYERLKSEVEAARVDYEKALDERKEVQRRNAERTTPNSATELRAARKAVDDAADVHDKLRKELKSIESVSDRFIDGIVPKNLRKLLEKIDKESARPIAVDQLETPTSGMKGKGFTLFPLTEKVKRSVIEEGQPLFSRQDAKKLSQDVEAFAAHLESVLKDAEKPEPPRMMDDVLKEGPKQTAEMMERYQGEQAMRAAKAEAARLAAAKSLDMSPEARKQRAEQMGFDTSKVWYHGTAGELRGGSFDPSMRGDFNPNALSKMGYFFSAHPEVSANYAEGAEMSRDRGGANIVPVYLKTGKQKIIDYKGYDSSVHTMWESVQAARDEGYDSVVIRNQWQGNGIGVRGNAKDPAGIDYLTVFHSDERARPTEIGKYADVKDQISSRPMEDFFVAPDEIVIFDPSNIRSVNAAFDPAESQSAKLLADLPSAEGSPATSAIARLSQEIEAAYPGATRLISDALDAAPDLRARIMEMAGDPNQQGMARSLMEAALPPRAPVDVPQQVNTSQPLGYTVTAQSRMAEIRAEIDRTLQMLPPDVRIRVEDQLVFNMGGKDVRVDGLWDGYDKIVYVALSAGDPVRTVRHEVIHALRQTGLMTRDEFNSLYEFAEKLKLRDAYNIDSMYRDGYTRAYGHKGNDYVELLLREETVANMFSDYSLNGRRFGDVAGGGIIDQIIDKIVRFMTAVRDRLDILGFKQVRDIFEEIESGRMAMRQTKLPDGSIVQGTSLNDLLAAIRAYHGSPHDFDRFDMSKIGTGEGAQAFGHGLYFAEGEDVARYYRDALSKKPTLDGRPILDQQYNLTTTTGDEFLDKTLRESFGDIALARQTLEANIKSEPWKGGVGGFWEKKWSERVAGSKAALASLNEIEQSGRLGNVSPGRMYEVNIKANPDDFLDWDKPLSQQSEKVKGALANFGQTPQDFDIAIESLRAKRQNPLARGGDSSAYIKAIDDRIAELEAKKGAYDVPAGQFIQRLEYGAADRKNQPAASSKLRDAGIPGIRYLDQGSRTAGEGTYNYVVFDDSLIEIVAKDGKPVSVQDAIARGEPGAASETPVVQEIRDMADLAGACKS